MMQNTLNNHNSVKLMSCEYRGCIQWISDFVIESKKRVYEGDTRRHDELILIQYFDIINYVFNKLWTYSIMVHDDN